MYLTKDEEDLLMQTNKSVLIVTKCLLYNEPKIFAYVSLSNLVNNISSTIQENKEVNVSILKQAVTTSLKLLSPFVFDKASSMWDKIEETNLVNESWPRLIVNDTIENINRLCMNNKLINQIGVININYAENELLVEAAEDKQE